MDEEAFVAFFDATVRDVYRYASRLTGRDRHAAEDLVQDAYAGYARELRAGRISAGGVGVGWLITVVRNRHIDIVRRNERARRKDVLTAVQPEAAPDADASVDLLDGLPPDQRSAMVLRYVDDLSVAEVAAALGRTVHATESLLARARAAARATRGATRG